VPGARELLLRARIDVRAVVLVDARSENDPPQLVEGWPRSIGIAGDRTRWLLSLASRALFGGSGSGHRAGEPRRLLGLRVRFWPSDCRAPCFSPSPDEPWLERAVVTAAELSPVFRRTRWR